MITWNLYNPFSYNIILYLNLKSLFKAEQFVTTKGKMTWKKKLRWRQRHTKVNRPGTNPAIFKAKLSSKHQKHFRKFINVIDLYLNYWERQHQNCEHGRKKDKIFFRSSFILVREKHYSFNSNDDGGILPVQSTHWRRSTRNEPK